ncbi:hypothetical protein Tco_0436316 [Tanacetum coccineum]
MSTLNKKTLADSGDNEIPPMLEKGNYIPWENRFRRFLDSKLKEGDQMWHSIEKGPYVRPMILNPNKPTEQILEPLSKMTVGNKKQYITDVRVMNYLLQAIPNDIYNLVDACKNAKDIWERIKRLMYGSDITSHVRHSRLMDEFDKFAAKEGELLESVYERLTTLVNIMDHNNVCPILVSINTKFLNCLQPEWSKYVTMVRHNKTGDVVSYDELYDFLVQFEPHVQASKAKKAAKNHDPLARLANSNASSSQSYANSSYSPQPYYKFFTPTNNLLRTSSNTRNQVVIQDGRVDIQTKNAGYGGNAADNAESEPSYDAKAVSEVNALNKVHEQVNHTKRKTIVHTSDDDQIDSNIIFDDPYMENNGGTSLAKKAFKERENRYLEDICDLEEKLSSHDQIVYKMGQSIQTIHMLGKQPNKVYDPFLKAALGYKNPECLKKAIAAQPKMYHGEMLHSTNLKIDSPNFEEMRMRKKVD